MCGVSCDSVPEGVGLHQDVRQCALCLEVGDDFPDVSFTVSHILTLWCSLRPTVSLA